MSWSYDASIGTVNDEAGEQVAALIPRHRQRGPLIAAAPDLYEALGQLLQEAEWCAWPDDKLRAARAALAKARPAQGAEGGER